MLNSQALRDRIDAFLEASGMSPTRLGREAVSDPSFVFDIRKGRVPSLDTAERLIAFIEKQPSQSAASAKESAA